MTDVKFKTKVVPVENRPCKFDKTQHTWHQIVFKHLDGTFSYCILCYLEREKYFDKEIKQIRTRYYPFGTWFKIFEHGSSKKKDTESKSETNAS